VTLLHNSAGDHEEDVRLLDLGKHLTTWRIDVCLIQKEPLGPASKLLALRLLPDSSAALIAKTQASRNRAPLLQHRLSCRYPSFALLSHFTRQPTSHNPYLPGTRAPTTPIALLLNIFLSHHETASRPARHRATRHVSIQPPRGTRLGRQEQTERLEE
jgi:hypothetical protein